MQPCSLKTTVSTECLKVDSSILFGMFRSHSSPSDTNLTEDNGFAAGRVEVFHQKQAASLDSCFNSRYLNTNSLVS